ncbi:MAG TPA: FG-GAP-like repeat-containing protein [Candidatus Acidoferrum sp.]|nr:FG-GAP-like repeat-containing protein [Candidatus Acidoferrum sp.]
MRTTPFTAATALMLSWVLVCPAFPAQEPQSPNTKRDAERSLVKPDPKRAKKLVEQAAKEEAAGDFIRALGDYEEAARYAPFDVTIVGRGTALRSRLLREHLDGAERLAVEGNIDGATQQLAAALEIDPRNPAILERLQQIGSMKESARGERRAEPAEGLPQIAPQKSNKSFNLQTDVKSAYEQVAQAFGLKATFDPDLQARNTRLHLQNVDFYTAMKVLGMETGTFWNAVDSRQFFVAADTGEKRRQFEPEIEQNIPLTGSVTATEMSEVVRAIRELTGITRVSQSNAAHSITVRGSVQRVHLAEEIVRNLEHGPGEVLLEIDLLEVDRSNARNLGITWPANQRLVPVSPSLANSLRSAPDLTSLLTILAQVFGGPAGALAAGGISSLASSIPAVEAIGGGKSTFLMVLPTLSAQFSEGLSLVHSGRQVLLRAQDGKPATFFVGDRVPITLSLLSGSLGSAGFTPNPGGTGVGIPTQQFTVGRNPVAMVTADFRNAGTQDLAVVNQTDNTLTILLNQGTGAVPQFAQPTSGIGLVSPIGLGTKWTSTTPAPAMATGSLNAASSAVNNDNFADLLVTDPVGNAVIVLLGNDDGSFQTPAAPIAVGTQPSAIAIGTFNGKNGDSNPGFVVTNFADNTYSVFNGNGDGTFTAVTGAPFALPTTGTGPVAMTVADFDGDGNPDLAIVNQGTQNVTILQGRGDGTFAEFPNSPLAVGKFPVAITSGALSGSTGPALAVVNQQDNSLSVFLGNGNGTFFEASQSPLATDTTPSNVVIADLAQSSTGGIAVTNTAVGTVTVFADLGSGLFTSAIEPAAGTNPDAILAGAFTNSSFPDIVVTNNISNDNGQVTLVESPASLISNAAITQTPYPGSEYEDVGIKIKATPQLHDTKEVTLQLEFEIKSLSGSSLNGIPVISNRTVTQTVRLKEDETSLITGLLSENETRTLSGIPGLAQLPGVGYAFGTRSNSFSNDELIFLITPRRVRSPFHEAKTIYAGTGEPTGRQGAASPPSGPRPDEPVPAQPPVETPAAPPAATPQPQPGAPPGQPPPANQPPQPQLPQQQPEIPLQEPPG